MPELSASGEDPRTGTSVEALRRAFREHVRYSQMRDERLATARDRFRALADTVRDRLLDRWIETQEAYYQKDAKRIYYLSAEFLIGRSLANNLYNLGLMPKAREALNGLGIELDDLLEEENDAGLGNGGLGRLAACFLDSMATLGLAGYGYGIRYEFGIFDQQIRSGFQVERPDEWLRAGNPWEIARPEYAYEVKFGGRTMKLPDGRGGFTVRWEPGSTVIGVPYDTPIAGYGGKTVNTMRLWRARASHEFDLAVFNSGDYVRAVEQKNDSETISKVLYPPDNSAQGKELRLKQQHFFVSCSIQDIVRRYLTRHQSLDLFADKVAIQLNDTHPAIAIAELMRILIDELGTSWERAWDITRTTCAYTNHTLLGEALERWPLSLFERLLPRHLEIIFEINYRFLRDVMNRFPLDHERVKRLSLIEEGPVRQVRMAHLAVVGSHKVNGVAELHSQLLQGRLLKDFHDLWPDRFTNKTNGVTPRRWLGLANPALATLVTDAIGDGWITDLEQLRRLEPLADDAAFRAKFREIKRANKASLADTIAGTVGVRIDPAAMLDVQIKRMHEYKRQLLNIVHVVSLYGRMKREPGRKWVPRTFLIAGKAAPGYFLAKLIIKLIHAVADVVNNDPEVSRWMRLVFVPNYSVSLAQRIIPAAEVSEQISTAGFEASGTGNMKLSLNGALTVGTLDGANIEIRDAVGAENFFLFGMTAEEVVERKRGHRPAAVIADDPDLRAVIELIGAGFFSPEQPHLFHPILENLTQSDPYLVTADFRAYAQCHEEVARVYEDPEKWTRMAILNMARVGRFSSDRAIREYAAEIWRAPVP